MVLITHVMRRRGFVSAPLLVITLTLVSLAGLWRLVVNPERAPLGVVIVTLDTTRADRLSAYGYMDAVMPHLDRLAREGIVFDRATSVAPLTLPAHCSLFTGLFPRRMVFTTTPIRRSRRNTRRSPRFCTRAGFEPGRSSDRPCSTRTAVCRRASNNTAALPTGHCVIGRGHGRSSAPRTRPLTRPCGG